MILSTSLFFSSVLRLECAKFPQPRILVACLFFLSVFPTFLVLVLVLPPTTHSATKLEILSQTTPEAFPVTGMVQTDLGPLAVSKYKEEPVDDSVSTRSIPIILHSFLFFLSLLFTLIRDVAFTFSSFALAFSLFLSCKHPRHRLSCKISLLQYHSDPFLDFPFIVFPYIRRRISRCVVDCTALFSFPRKHHHLIFGAMGLSSDLCDDEDCTEE